MLEEMIIASAIALFIIVPIVVGELIDRLLRVSWHYIKKLV
jgi:hypothetical protein